MMGEVKDLTIEEDGCKGQMFFDDHGIQTSIVAECKCGHEISHTGDCSRCGFAPMVCFCLAEYNCEKMKPELIEALETLKKYFNYSIESIEDILIDVNRESMHDMSCDDDLRTLVHDWSGLEQFERQNQTVIEQLKVVQNFEKSFKEFCTAMRDC
jgi:hypothetical protein